MAKENVVKFFEKLAEDAALAEKLNALDKAFADKNDASADDAAMREKAAGAVVLPLAEEAGLPFTLEELKEYEHEQVKNMTLSEDELAQVAGGKGGKKKKPKYEPSRGKNACAFVGVGFGVTIKNDRMAVCIFIGGSDGPIAG